LKLILFVVHLPEKLSESAGASFINDCLLQPMLHVSHLLLQFADITCMQYAIEISSNSNFQLSQGSVETYLR